MSDTSKVTKRFELIKAMDTIIKSMNYEGAYYDHWIVTGPADPCGDDDIADVCDNEECFKSAVRTFLTCMEEYGKSGIYFQGKLYQPWSVENGRS